MLHQTFLSVCAALLLAVAFKHVQAFSPQIHTDRTIGAKVRFLNRASVSPNEEPTNSESNNDDEKEWQDSKEQQQGDNPSFQTSTVKIDDGGSNLTDRFKYKVNALMGVFDPSGEDNERQDGNILNAMLQFPVRFTFTAVGKTSGDADLKHQYTEQVKSLVGSMSGDEEGMQLQITPRGTKFTRVAVQAQVDSATIINSIFTALDELEMTVMHY